MDSPQTCKIVPAPSAAAGCLKRSALQLESDNVLKEASQDEPQDEYVAPSPSSRKRRCSKPIPTKAKPTVETATLKSPASVTDEVAESAPHVVVRRYKGVDFVRRRNMWRARIDVGGKRQHIGYFKTQVLAVAAYTKRAKSASASSSPKTNTSSWSPTNNSPQFEARSAQDSQDKAAKHLWWAPLIDQEMKTTSIPSSAIPLQEQLKRDHQVQLQQQFRETQRLIEDHLQRAARQSQQRTTLQAQQEENAKKLKNLYILAAQKKLQQHWLEDRQLLQQKLENEWISKIQKRQQQQQQQPQSLSFSPNRIYQQSLLNYLAHNQQPSNASPFTRDEQLLWQLRARTFDGWSGANTSNFQANNPLLQNLLAQLQRQNAGRSVGMSQAHKLYDLRQQYQHGQ
jgi:hypothetical protein